nr:sterol desaturase family protein [Mucilaginibacter sp. L294]
MLKFLSEQSSPILLMIFLIENCLVTLMALFAGWLTQKLTHKLIESPSRNEVLVCITTNLINTFITYAGFKMWQSGFLVFGFNHSWLIVFDFVLLFLVMDLAMYVLHYGIHHTAVYNKIHKFHHYYSHPKPIDLFVLHPLETVSFGVLWLGIISIYVFNFYAVIIYLIINVVFGIAGHLGTEPLSDKTRNSLLFKYLGSSTFHHNHHADINYNYGFYTNIWDRIFKTYKP